MTSHRRIELVPPALHISNRTFNDTSPYLLMQDPLKEHTGYNLTPPNHNQLRRPAFFLRSNLPPKCQLHCFHPHFSFHRFHIKKSELRSAPDFQHFISQSPTPIHPHIKGQVSPRSSNRADRNLHPPFPGFPTMNSISKKPPTRLTKRSDFQI